MIRPYDLVELAISIHALHEESEYAETRIVGSV